MGKIYRIIFTILFLFGFLTIHSQQSDVIFNVHNSAYLPENENSELLCTAFFEVPKADSALLQVIPSNVFTLSDSLYAFTQKEKITLQANNLFGKYSIPLNSSVLKKVSNSPFLFLFPFRNATENELNFSVTFYEDGKKIYEISSTEVNNVGKYLTPVLLKPFKSSNNRENSLFIANGGEFEVKTKFNSETLNTFTFWTKIDSATPTGNFFSIRFENSFDTLASLFIDKFRLLKFRDTLNANSLRDFFIMSNCWNKISLEISATEIKLFANDKEIARKTCFPSPSDSAIVTFANYSPAGFYLRKFSYKITDEEQNIISSNEIDFSQYSEIDSLSKTVKVKKCGLKKTGFPIVMYPPQIEISISSAYTTIEWYNDKDENISSFVLEKSTGYEDFVEIFRTENAETNRRYFYEDFNSENHVVIFYRIKQTDKNGETIYSRQVKVGKAKINDFILEQNYPNPFNPSTSFSLQVIVPGFFHIGVYDLVGKEIKVLHDGTLTQGNYEFDFDANNLPSGIYLLRVKSSNQTIVKKMIFAK